MHFIITLLNSGNVLLCVIYQLNLTVFVYVTRISSYMTLYIYIYIIYKVIYIHRQTAVFAGNTFQDLPRLRYIYILVYIVYTGI